MSISSLRIIGGVYRSRKITFDVGKEGGEVLRPSGNRVRETLFNWLNYDITQARIIDLFAGSGVLGFEALSRGASECISIEKNPFYIKQIANNAKALDCDNRMQIIKGSALTWLEKNSSSLAGFDIVFLDPPFADNYYAKVLDILANFLSEKCVVYIEYSRQDKHFSDKNSTIWKNWTIIKHSNISNVSLALIKKI
jgi:16S rRNA (guanine966-N2)-methyltransferase